MSFKPMLACNAELEKLTYPLLASPKFDGIRCIVLDGKALTRNLKPVPNLYTRDWLEANCQGFDGELVVGDPRAKDCFQRTTSAVMSKSGKPDVDLYVFDRTDAPERTFEARLMSVGTQIEQLVASGFNSALGVVHTRIRDAAGLARYEAVHVAEGWEGVMLRDPKGLYKYGRSTVREGGLLKVKRFADAEAVIVGFEERMHNANEATVDALGHLERSTHKANLKPLGDLGALIVEREGQRFTIGSGFTATQRVAIWQSRDRVVGQLVKFKYQEVGTKDAPRFPVFLGFRPEGA